MKFCGRSSCRGIWWQNLWMKHIQDFKKIEQNWVKLNEIGWNWVKLRVAIFAIFLTFVISCNFRQFWPIFVAVSGDLIGHFLYTSNFVPISRQIPEMSDVCRFFTQICENKLENCRKFWNLWKLFNIIQYYSIVSLVAVHQDERRHCKHDQQRWLFVERR